MGAQDGGMGAWGDFWAGARRRGQQRSRGRQDTLGQAPLEQGHRGNLLRSRRLCGHATHVVSQALCWESNALWSSF